MGDAAVSSAAALAPPTAAVAASAGSAGVTSGPARCAGLEYANMKKEEAREEYKERRRRELLSAGDVERVKRRKKNDSSMSDVQKYSRRLKMNQDSAAAARAAQDAYVSTLEKLLETGEAEKTMIELEAGNLRAERDHLAHRLNALHKEVVKSVPEAAAGAAKTRADVEGAGSLQLLRKIMELFATDESTAVVTNEAEFARGMLGLMPAPAV
jgi:hypothetical protein